MAEQIKRTPRADGQRNRVKLVQAAEAMARAGGGELLLDQVARNAGVSIATLYRHFPTREALLLEISQGDAIEYAELARKLLRSTTPVDALCSWLVDASRYGLTRPGMARAFRAASADPVSDRVYRTFIDALTSLLTAGQRIEEIRADITAEDLLLALCGLWDLQDSPQTREQCARVSRLLVDGLRQPKCRQS